MNKASFFFWRLRLHAKKEKKSRFSSLRSIFTPLRRLYIIVGGSTSAYSHKNKHTHTQGCFFSIFLLEGGVVHCRGEREEGCISVVPLTHSLHPRNRTISIVFYDVGKNTVSTLIFIWIPGIYYRNVYLKEHQNKFNRNMQIGWTSEYWVLPSYQSYS